MKAFTIWVFLGILVAAAVSTAGCTESSSGKSSTEETRRGTLKMALETASSSGKVYRLRRALMRIAPARNPDRTSVILNSEDDPGSPVVESFLEEGNYGITLQPGWFIEQVDTLVGAAARVDAELLGDPIRVFDIEANRETFVKFEFEVDGRRVVFGPPGRLNVGIKVHERDSGSPPTGLDPRRSLLETNLTAVEVFSLEQALAAAQINSNVEPDPAALYQQIIDSYASPSLGRLPGAVHCGDETTDGVPTLNGFPLRCDRLERLQFDNLGVWFATAAVNRIDLAPEDGQHCGQQRLIFANNAPIGNGRMFVIVEAQVPNPNPECGVEACKPLADFWAAQSALDDPRERGERLVEAFLTGSPDLAAHGFAPFLAVENLTIGSGNIRTNNFNDPSGWTLREFKLVFDPSGRARAIPFPVGEAPHGALWNDLAPLPAGPACRENFLEAIEGLLSDDPAEMAFVVNRECLDAESPNDFFSQDYATHLSNGSDAFRQRLAERLSGTGLTPTNIADRARFAGSCMGCHEESIGTSLGRGVVAPFSRGFVHVDEFSLEDCGDGSSCFGASQALIDVFLPRRLRALTDLLDRASCFDTGGDAGATFDGGAPEPPPEAVLSTDEEVTDLIEQEEAARARLTGHTLGGEPASVSH